MAQLRQDYEEFVQRGTEVIAIGPESTEPFARWWREHEMPFPGVADPEHLIASVYGQQVRMAKLGRMPASILIDRNGYIRYKHFGESMSDIPKDRLVLSLIDELNEEDASAA
jgi:peroxiredoxin